MKASLEDRSAATPDSFATARARIVAIVCRTARRIGRRLGRTVAAPPGACRTLEGVRRSGRAGRGPLRGRSREPFTCALDRDSGRESNVAHARLGRDPVAARERGMSAEAITCRMLRRNGWRILGRNVRIDRDEIDVLALEPDERTLVIVEVKAARRESDARARLDHGKRSRLARARRRLAREVRTRRPIRVDLVVVVAGQVVRHVRGVTLSQAGRRTSRHAPEAH